MELLLCLREVPRAFRSKAGGCHPTWWAAGNLTRETGFEMFVGKHTLFTESQNGRGWKGPLWLTQSNPPAEAGSPTAGCNGTLSRRVCNISREGDSTASLGSLFC